MPLNEKEQVKFAECVMSHRLQGASLNEAKLTCMELVKQVQGTDKKVVKGRKVKKSRESNSK